MSRTTPLTLDGRKTPHLDAEVSYFLVTFIRMFCSLKCVHQTSYFIFKYRLRGAWPAHVFIFHLQRTVSPGNNGALHYITRPLCIHAIQSDIQSGLRHPSHPRHYWQNNTLKKPSWPKKKERCCICDGA